MLESLVEDVTEGLIVVPVETCGDLLESRVVVGGGFVLSELVNFSSGRTFFVERAKDHFEFAFELRKGLDQPLGLVSCSRAVFVMVREVRLKPSESSIFEIAGSKDDL